MTQKHGVTVYPHVIEQKAQPWCERCNLPDDICRGHDADDLAAALLALDAMQELDLASALVRADVVRAIINDWRRGREEGGKSARIERLERKLNLVLSHLGISFE